MRAFVLCSAAIAASFIAGSSAWAQSASGPGDPNASKPPMQAQELSILVPKDSSQPAAVDISKQNARSRYRFDKQGVNCSLYPARCRDENY